MRTHFYRLADAAQAALHAGENFTLWLAGEQTDFVRFNHARVRQAGQVRQANLELRLVEGKRQARYTLALAGGDEDLPALRDAFTALREVLAYAKDDPYLLLNDAVSSSDQVLDNNLPPTQAMVDDIIAAAGDADLVGILAAGPIFHGFANGQGQRNWRESASWNFDWSLHGAADRAVKRGGAGFNWHAQAMAREVQQAREQLARLERPVRQLAPGNYRAYLTPNAMAALLGLLNWGGFSAREQQVRRSPLTRLAQQEVALSSMITLQQHAAAGLGPGFQAEGYIQPDAIPLITQGAQVGALVSPRTAMEYGLASTGTPGHEQASALSMAGGGLAQGEVLAQLGEGLYLENLHYLNYVDRTTARITGMTRFACFWVENGQLSAPLGVMRFDDTLYGLLGDRLEALTSQTHLIADAGSYEARSTDSVRVPGALLSGLNLVL